MYSSVTPNLKRSPYYIVAPHYVQTSAGIRCLHILCHWLNRLGERAYMVISGGDGLRETCLDLQTPVLTMDLVDYHYQQGLRPIVVYPEVISGNPFDAEAVVRWVLNFPGLLGGDSAYPEGDMVMAFSKILADAVDKDVPILHVPVINQDVFNMGEARPRSGAAFYAAKFKHVHNGVVFNLPKGAIEITRDRRDSQTPEEIAEIFRSVETFYCFENTALAIEAVLCGCPAVFMPNEWLDVPIAMNELGWEGYAWGNDPAEIERARNSVTQGQANYQRTIAEFFEQLHAFIERSQAKVAGQPYVNKVKFFKLQEETLAVMSAKRISRIIRFRPTWGLKGLLRVYFALIWATLYGFVFQSILKLGRRIRAAAVRLFG